MRGSGARIFAVSPRAYFALREALGNPKRVNLVHALPQISQLVQASEPGPHLALSEEARDVLVNVMRQSGGG